MPCLCVTFEKGKLRVAERLGDRHGKCASGVNSLKPVMSQAVGYLFSTFPLVHCPGLFCGLVMFQSLCMTCLVTLKEMCVCVHVATVSLVQSQARISRPLPQLCSS